MKTCHYCGQQFQQTSNVQVRCFDEDCIYQQKLDKWRRRNENHRASIYAANRARYYRRRMTNRKPTSWKGKIRHAFFYRLPAKERAYVLFMNRIECTSKMNRALQNVEVQKRRLKGLRKRPTVPELVLIRIIKKYNLPFKYVGNGEFFIGRANPDFISTDNSNRVIEVFGDYWHKLDGILEISTEAGRKKIFTNAGYKTLVIWESDILDMSDTQILQSILKWEVMV